MDKQSIGLCLAYTGTNYGQLLQAFATQEILREKGFHTEILKYYSGNNKGIKLSYGALVVFLKHVISSIKRFIIISKRCENDEIHKKNSYLRKEVAEDFRKNRLHDIVLCTGINELQRQSKSYFAVLVGSDQVWLPDISVTNFYTLRFAAPGVRKISYATSLGVSSFPNYAKKPAGDYWKQIDYLSVREQQGKDIIRSIVDIPVEVVVDPTYLFTREEWLRLIPPQKIIEDGYILCYFLGDSCPVKQFARKFADDSNLRLVSILSDECNSDDSKYADEVLIGKTVEDFVNLIRGAEFILTDSFHGLAFSVINQKQVLVFYRKRDDVKESRNSRIDSIVRLWGIEDRLIRDPEIAPLPEHNIDYQEVSTRVKAQRERSLSFLDKALYQ